MDVTTALTYPSRLIAIESGGKLIVDGIIIGSPDNNAVEIQFETVSLEEIAADEELSAWVDRLYKQAGIHYKHKDDYVYA